MKYDKTAVKAILSLVLLAMSFGTMVPVANGHEKGPDIDITEALRIAEMRERRWHSEVAWRVTFVGKRYMKGRAYWLVYFRYFGYGEEMGLDGGRGFFIDAQTAEVVGTYR